MKKERLRIELSKAETLPVGFAVRAKLFVNDRPRYQAVKAGNTTGEAQSRAFWAALHEAGYNYAPGAGLVRLTNRGTARLGVLVRVEEIQAQLSAAKAERTASAEGPGEDLSSLSTDDLLALRRGREIEARLVANKI